MRFNSRPWVAAVILTLVILIGFVLSVPHAREVRDAFIKDKVATSTAPQITLKDTYKKGVHTLSGTVMAPNACVSVSAQASLASSTGITLDISMPPATGMCLEVATAAPFSTTIAAPSGLPIEVLVNGALATTTSP